MMLNNQFQLTHKFNFMSITHAIGRRKTSIARVYLKKGKGNVSVNKRDLTNYFATTMLQYKVNQPFALTDTVGQYDVKVSVVGGGVTGQAEAIRLGISRALVSINPDFRLTLKPDGLMTRDPRMVERKKFGQKKARKRFQFSKR
jgi:small subunit ribosomal protein S9|tara:strand:- start:989 stop:1420 length:432 start_codon:yes stop_codon:yes gene_type:complete